MGKLWRAFVMWFNQHIYEFEMKHPEGVYDEATDELTSQRAVLSAAAGRVVRLSDDLEEEFTQKNSQYLKLGKRLEAAAGMETVDEAAAVQALEIYEQLEDELFGENGLEARMKMAQKDEEHVRAALLELEGEINKIKREKATQVGKLRAAEATIQIRDTISGMTVNETLQSLDRVRGKIKDKVSQAKMVRENHDNSLDQKLKNFEKATDTVSAKTKFQQMRENARRKAASEASTAAQTTAKTL